MNILLKLKEILFKGKAVDPTNFTDDELIDYLEIFCF